MTKAWSMTCQRWRVNAQLTFTRLELFVCSIRSCRTLLGLVVSLVCAQSLMNWQTPPTSKQILIQRSTLIWADSSRLLPSRVRMKWCACSQVIKEKLAQSLLRNCNDSAPVLNNLVQKNRSNQLWLLKSKFHLITLLLISASNMQIGSVNLSSTKSRKRFKM